MLNIYCSFTSNPYPLISGLKGAFGLSHCQDWMLVHTSFTRNRRYFNPEVQITEDQIPEFFPLVWNFSTSKFLQNIEKLHERALMFLYNDHTSSYNDLLSKSDRCTMLILAKDPFALKFSRPLTN